MGLERSIKRKRMNIMRKQFMKEFKKKMKEFKKQVKCITCNRPPSEGENIDNWRINKNSENIDLMCTACAEAAQEPEDV